jgi:4'-phosphopantetheinyl transferase
LTVPATTQPTWAPGPLRPTLGDGAVHAWRANLAAMTDEVCELLCREELARAERMLRERDRRLWRRSRGVLRALLGRYLHEDPRVLCFATGERGKPAVADCAGGSPAAHGPSSTGRARLSFNMSHSGRLALYAFSHAGAVGVDVEVARRPIDELAIAARVFGPAQTRRLEGLDREARRREFMRAWVRHEAELKCLGVGLAGVDEADEGRRPSVAELEMESDAAAALATERPTRELRCWDWR